MTKVFTIFTHIRQSNQPNDVGAITLIFPKSNIPKLFAVKTESIQLFAKNRLVSIRSKLLIPLDVLYVNVYGKLN